VVEKKYIIKTVGNEEVKWFSEEAVSCHIVAIQNMQV